MNFLRLKDRPDQGVTVLLSPKWIFVSVLTQPYATNSNGCPVYLDGFAFAGLMNLQTIEQKWPATAGLEDDKIHVLGAFEKSTFINEVIETEDEEDNQTSAE